MDLSPRAAAWDLSLRPLRALLVEPDHEGPSGFRPSLEALGGRQIEFEGVGLLSAALERVSLGGIDVLILDLNLPDSQGLTTFERAQAFAPGIPIVVLTEVEDEEVALTTVRSGAQDYLVKGKVSPDLVCRSIRYAVERHRLTSALRSLSLIDDLTGLYNRRGFTELGEQSLRLARRSRRAVLLVYMDVDRLKAINDTLGH
jgi:PleD family two-component response regulator